MENVAIISVVGDGMRTLKGISARFSALTRGNINIVAIAQGSSERSISAVITMIQQPMLCVCAIKCFSTPIKLLKSLLLVLVVGSALIEQIHRQQAWLKNKHIDLRMRYC